MAITIPGFDVASELGRGGFGVVYQAWQPSLNRTVAIKVLMTVGASGADAQRRFERECKALGSLRAHPNIVSVYQTGITEEGSPFLVMDYLPGGTLADRVPLTQDQVTAIGITLADALDSAHRRGVVHRDVKPRNVLFDEAGAPVLVDFGIASMAGEVTTATSSITASIAYAAPEVLDGHRGGHPADVYGLGATLFTALTGEVPFWGGAEMPPIAAMIARIATVPVEQLRPDGVGDALWAAIATAMAKDPAARFANMAELRTALQAAVEPGSQLAGEATVIAHVGPTERPTEVTVPANVGLVTAIVGLPKGDEQTQVVNSAGSTQSSKPRRRVSAAAIASISVAAAIVVGTGVAAAATNGTFGLADDSHHIAAPRSSSSTGSPNGRTTTDPSGAHRGQADVGTESTTTVASSTASAPPSRGAVSSTPAGQQQGSTPPSRTVTRSTTVSVKVPVKPPSSTKVVVPLKAVNGTVTLQITTSGGVTQGPPTLNALPINIGSLSSGDTWTGVQITSGPTWGSAYFSGRYVYYTPVSDTAGKDSLTFRFTNGSRVSNTATLTIKTCNTSGTCFQ